MRFRAKMSDNCCIRHFLHILHSIDRLCASNTCTLKLSPTHVSFHTSTSALGARSEYDTGVCTDAGLYCSVPQHSVFNEYDFVGVCDDENLICMDINPASLWRPLTTKNSTISTGTGGSGSMPSACADITSHVFCVRMKLARKHGSACMSIHVQYDDAGRRVSVRDVVHDVPITLLPRRLWLHLDEPKLAKFQCSIELPALRHVKHVMDRMKGLGCKHVGVAASARGHLRLQGSAQAESAHVTTHFRHLRTYADGASAARDSDGVARDGDGVARDDSTRADEDTMHEVFVCVRLFTQLLSLDSGATLAALGSGRRVVCNIVVDCMLQVLVIHRDVTFQYIIPAVIV